MKRIALVIFLFASCAFAQSVTPRKNFTFETGGIRINEQPIEIRQATSVDFYFTFKNDSYYMNFPTNSQVRMIIAPTNNAWTSIVTGSIDSATRGRVKIPMLPADNNTNGVFEYDITISYTNGPSGVTNVLADAHGPFIIDRRVGSGITSTFPPNTNNPVDLSGYIFINFPWVGGSGSTNTNGVTTFVYNKGSTFSGSISGDILTMTYPSNINYFSTIGTNSWNGLFDEYEGVYYLDLANMTGTLADAVADLITRVGTVTSGTWQATAIADAYLTKTGAWTGTFDGQEGVYYLDMANMTGTLANAVSDLITRVGTIVSGVWQGTAVGDNYIIKTGDWTGTLDGFEAAAFVKTNTSHGGDVSGIYNNLQIGEDKVGLFEVDTDSLDTRYVQTGTSTWTSISVYDMTSQGSELVSNGDFASNALWAIAGDATYASTRIEMLTSGSGTVIPSNALTIVRGKTYLIECQKGTGGATNIFSLGGDTWTTTGSGYISNIVTISDSTTNLNITMQTTAASGDWFDNVSIKEITDGDLVVADDAFIGGDFYLGEDSSIFFPTSDLTQADMDNWDTAHGWGNHSTNNYVSTTNNNTWDGGTTNRMDQLYATNVFIIGTATVDRIYRTSAETEFGDTEYVTEGHVQQEFSANAATTIFFATNVHPVVSGSAGLWDALPGSAWEETTALSTGTNLVETWAYTNIVVNRISAGTYVVHMHASKSGAGNPTVTLYAELIEVGILSTNVISTSETKTLSTVNFAWDLHIHSPTNYASTNYVGARIWAVRSGGSSANIILYGGDADSDSHFRTPDSLQGGGFMQKLEDDIDPKLGAGLDAQNFGITDLGNVGIGVASPSIPLQVEGASTIASFKTTTAGAANILKVLADDDGTVFQVAKDASDNGYIQLLTGGGSVEVEIDSAGVSYFNGGFFGLGTNDPKFAFHFVGGASDRFAFTFGTNQVEMYFNTTSNRMAFDDVYNGTTNATIFFTPPR